MGFVRAHPRGFLSRQTIVPKRTNLEIYEGISAVALGRGELQVALEVAGVEPGEREPVSVSRQRHRLDPVSRLRCRRVHVVEQALVQAPRDPAALIRYLRQEGKPTISSRLVTCRIKWSVNEDKWRNNRG